MSDTQCPWIDPDWVNEGYATCTHKTHKLKQQKDVYCSCLRVSVPGVPVLMKGHSGTDECCSDFCPECGYRACFEHPGCYPGDYDDDIYFADPGGRSALRAATHDRCPRHGCHKKVGVNDNYCKACGYQLNPRCHPCPTCGTPNALTPEDVAAHYQCDSCADRAEGTYVGADY